MDKSKSILAFIDTCSEDGSIRIGSPEWKLFLKDAQSFRYIPSSDGYQINRAEVTVNNRSSKGYWYAYKKHNKRLYSYYLGKAEDITYEKLQLAVDNIDFKMRNQLSIRKIKNQKSKDSQAENLLVIQNSEIETLYNSSQALSEIEELRAANEQLKEEIKSLKAQLDDSLKLENLQHQIRSIQDKLACKEKGYAANSAASLIRDIKSL
jgi:multidrug resistance efflux pump